MKIAVTGASGFLGTEFIKACRNKSDVQVVALTRSEQKRADGFVTTDYSVDSLVSAFAGVDTVVHLAAVRGTEGTISDYSCNAEILEDVLLAMDRAGVGRIVFASSIAVYSDTDKMPWKENCPLSPKTLYGVSKVTCENLCQYYGKRFGYDYSILRIAQVLGAGEKKKNMGKVFCEQAAAGEQLTVIGRSVARRQFIYCGDVAEILYRLAESESIRNVVLNAGMEEAHTNLEVAEAVNKVFGNPVPVRYEADKPETIEPSIMDVTELNRLMGYRCLSLEETFERIRKEYT